MKTPTSGRAPLDIAVFTASSGPEAWGDATAYHHGLLRSLAGRGHRISLYAPAAEESEEDRTDEAWSKAHAEGTEASAKAPAASSAQPPSWARIVTYELTDSEGLRRALEQARDADVIIKMGGSSPLDALLDGMVSRVRRPDARLIYWDTDAAATLTRLRKTPEDRLHAYLGRYDFVFTSGGGDAIVRGFEALGARRAVPIYAAFQSEAHQAVSPEPLWLADLALYAEDLTALGPRLEELFLKSAEALPEQRFLLAGAGFEGRDLPPNVLYLGPIPPARAAVIYASALAVLHLPNDAAPGCCPRAELFAAAGAGACVITDSFAGIDFFLDPGREVLIARDAASLQRRLATLTSGYARAIGALARRRVMLAHTYAERAEEVEAWLVSDQEAFSTPLAA